MAVEDGQKYTVSTVKTDNFNLNYENGTNSALNRPEFVDVYVSENPGKKCKLKNYLINIIPAPLVIAVFLISGHY